MLQKERRFDTLTTFKAIHIIVIVGFLVFGNALFNTFIWDDKIYIIYNTQVHALNFVTLFGENLFNAGGTYRPVLATYFSTLYVLFKELPFFYHFIQITIHIVNAGLFFLFFKEFFNKKISLFLSLIFLVHPMQVESVAFIAASGSPVSFFFGISAMLLSKRQIIDKKRLLLIFALLLLSFLSKETGIQFLLVILLYRLLFRNTNNLPFIINSGIILVIYSLLRLGVGKVLYAKATLVPIAMMPLIERLINIPAIIYYYLSTFFFPYTLAIDQFWIIKSVDSFNFYFPTVVISLLLIIYVLFGRYLLRINKKIFYMFLFFGAWFVIGIFLYLQIIPLDMTVSDRWFYFPMVGMLGIIGIILQHFLLKKRSLEVLGFILGIVIITIFSLRTIIRNMDWSNPITLYTHDSQIEKNYDIENNLGVEYMNIKKYKEALYHYKKSVEFFPYEVNLYNTGAVYEETGDLLNAKKYYYYAINNKHTSSIQRKHNIIIYERLAFVLFSLHEFEAAKKVINRGLIDYPNYGKLWMYLAVSEYKLQNKLKALEIATKAYQMIPSPESQYVLTQISTNQEVKLQ